MEVELKTFNEEFLRLSWRWLNDPEVKFLTNSREITKEEQIDWFNSLPERKDYLIWGLEAALVPIGACGLKNITDSDCEYWGYIGDKSYWGHGFGNEMIILAEEKARGLGLSSIWLKVISENTRAISLYKKKGYILESETDGLFVMRKKL